MLFNSIRAQEAPFEPWRSVHGSHAGRSRRGSRVVGGARGRQPQMGAVLLLLLLVPVLVRVISHEAVRGIDRRLVGTLPPAGRIHHCVILNAVAAAVASVAAASVVGGGGGGVAVVAAVVAFPDGGRRRGVAGHGVAGVRTVVESNVAERELAVLVQLLEL